MRMSPTDMIYLPFGRLFASERVFEAADGIQSLAFDLVGLAVRFQLGVTEYLPATCFTAPLICCADPAIRSLSMISSSKANSPPRTGEVCYDAVQPADWC